jgi:D-sedoheptulose 7-phosphate isomerase
MNNIDRFFSKNEFNFINSYFNYLNAVLSKIQKNEIIDFIKLLLEARNKKATIFFIGNGGSAATASHFANDLSVGVFLSKNPFRAISLTDNMPVITAIANDFGYSEIFKKQLEILAKKDDLLVAISASGNSPNLIKAIEHAKQIGMVTIAITGFDGGQIKMLADNCIHVPTEKKEYGPVEDAHMILDHMITAYLARLLQNE